MKKLLISILLFTSLLPLNSLAADFQSEDRYFISSPINDDLYVAGWQIQIKSDIEGDLILIWGEIDITWNIKNDLNAIWWRILIWSDVNDDVRAIWGEVEIHKNIRDDLIIWWAWRVKIYKAAEIWWDLVVNGWEIRIDWNIKWDITINWGRVVLNWNVWKDAKINSGLIEINWTIEWASKLIAGEIILGPESSFWKEVNYWTEKWKIDFWEASAVYIKDLWKDFIELDLEDWAFNISLKILMLLSWMLAIYVLLFWKKYFVNTANKLERYPFKCFGLWVMYFILTPILLTILMITIIWIPFAMLWVAAFIFTIVFAGPVTAVLLAFLWDKRKRWKWTKFQVFWVSVWILAALKFACIIPFFWWLISAIFIISAFGAFIIQDWEYIRKYF